MQKHHLFLIIAVCAIFALSKFFCGCTKNAAETYDKAKIKSVVIFNQQPNQDSNDNDRYLAQEILRSKGEKEKKFKISASGYVDDKKYLKKHPNDGLTISSSNSEGRVDVRVYSDNPTPDPEFFETD